MSTPAQPGVGIAESAWHWLALGAAIDYLLAAQMVGLPRLQEEEQNGVRDVASWIGTSFLCAVLWKWLPEAWLGAGWMALGVALFELGLLLRVSSFRRQAATVGALAYGALLYVNVIGASAPVARNIAVLGAATLLSYPFALQSSRCRFRSCVPRRAAPKRFSIARGNRPSGRAGVVRVAGTAGGGRLGSHCAAVG